MKPRAACDIWFLVPIEPVWQSWLLLAARILSGAWPCADFIVWKDVWCPWEQGSLLDYKQFLFALGHQAKSRKQMGLCWKVCRWCRRFHKWLLVAFTLSDMKMPKASYIIVFWQECSDFPGMSEAPMCCTWLKPNSWISGIFGSLATLGHGKSTVQILCWSFGGLKTWIHVSAFWFPASDPYKWLASTAPIPKQLRIPFKGCSSWETWCKSYVNAVLQFHVLTWHQAAAFISRRRGACHDGSFTAGDAVDRSDAWREIGGTVRLVRKSAALKLGTYSLTDPVTILHSMRITCAGLCK